MTYSPLGAASGSSPDGDHPGRRPARATTPTEIRSALGEEAAKEAGSALVVAALLIFPNTIVRLLGIVAAIRLCVVTARRVARRRGTGTDGSAAGQRSVGRHGERDGDRPRDEPRPVADERG